MKACLALERTIPGVRIAALLATLASGTATGQVLPDSLNGRAVVWGPTIPSEWNIPSLPSDLVQAASSQVSFGPAYGVRSNGTVVSLSHWFTAPQGLSGVKAVSVGERHAAALRSDGTVVCWGSNDFGETNVPPGLSNVIAIACGGHFSIALRSNGTVVQWRDTLAYIGSPPPGLTGVRAIAAGYHRALAVKNDGTVVGWGQVEVPAGLSNVIAVSAGGSHTLALRADGAVVAWGDNSAGQSEVPGGLTDAVAVHAGYDHSVVLKRDGSVLAWGGYGSLAHRVPAGLANVFSIATGRGHSLALQTGPVLISGPSNVLASIGANIAFSVAVVAPEKATYQWQFQGIDLFGATQPTLVVTNAQTADAGEYSVLVSSDGFTIRATASLSLATAPTILVPPEDTWVPAGGDVSFQVQATNVTPQRYQWTFESVAIPMATNSILTLTNVQLAQAGLYSVRVISAWGLETNVTVSLVVLPARPMGEVVSWGSQTNVPAGSSGVIAISAGNYHTLALRADGTVLAWGNNEFGQSTVPLGLRNIIAVAAGGRHSLALRNDGRIVGWGHNFNGQAASPIYSDCIAVAAGDSHSLAVRSGGGVVAWGNGFAGGTAVPPGLADVIAVAAGSHHSLALKRNGTVVGWGDNSGGQSVPPPDLSNVVAIAAGHVRSVALRADGSVYDSAEPALPEASNVISVATQYGCSLVARADGQILTWGFNSIPAPAGLTQVIAVAAGQSHRVALRETGVFIVTSPTNVAALLGTEASFRVHALGVSPVTYQWQANGTNLSGATNESLRLTNIARSSAGIYSVAVSSPRGTSTSTGATLTVLSPPLITASPQSQAVLAGTNVLLSVEAIGTDPLRYQWFFNGVAISTATGSALSIAPATPTAAGDYRVRISNTYGAVTSAVATLTVNLPPSLLVQPVSHWVVMGSNTQFSVSAAGTPPLSFQWLFNGQSLGAPNQPILQLTGAQSTEAGAYSVLVTNAFGSVTSAVARLDVVPPSPTIVMPPLSQTTALGSTVTFEVAATGVLPLSYEWRRGQAVIPGATLVTLTLEDVDADSEGDYSVIVRNTFGAATSTVARLSVRLRPNVIAWGLNNENQTRVPADLTNAIAIAAGWHHALAVRPDGTVSAWGNGPSVPLGLSNVIAVSAGEYHSLALRADGTVVGWGNSPYGAATPPNGLSNVVQVVAGSLHSLALKTDGTVVGWGYNYQGLATPPANLNDAVWLAAGFEHSVAVRRDGTLADWGLYYGDTRRFSNVVAMAGQGLDFAALLSDGTVLDWAAFKYTGTNVVATNAMAIAVGSAPINFPAHGLAVTRDGKVVGWGDNSFGESTPPPDLPSVLTVAAGYRFSLALVRAPQFTVQPVSQTKPEGSEVVFRTAAASEGPVEYQWTFNGIALPGETGSTLTLTNVSLDQAGTYRVTARNAYGSASSREAHLTVISRAPLITRQPVSQSVLIGEELVAFQIEVSALAPPTFQWMRNGTELAGATNSFYVITEVQSSDAGAYTVVVSNEYGQLISAPAILTVRVADLIIDNTAATLIGNWLLDPTAPGRFGVDVRWRTPEPIEAGAQFIPTLPRAAVYEVYEWHPTAASQASTVLHEVVWSGGTSFVEVNQATNGGQWNLLGAYAFARGAAGHVRITDRVSNPDHVVVADAIRFVHVPSPPKILDPPHDQTVVVGAAAALTCTATGDPPLNYQWQRNGQNIPGATNITLAFAAVRFADAGNYRLLLSNADGTLFSPVVRLVVAGPPLGASMEGGSWRLTWPAGYRLQSATNILGPYEYVPDALSPLQIEFERPREFFRLSE